MEKGEKKLLTKHPAGKNGVNIINNKYGTTCKAKLDTLAKNGMSNSNIVQAVKAILTNSFKDSIE